MKRTASILVAMALGLGACATVQSVSAKAPDIERTLALPIEKVRDCLIGEHPMGFDVAHYQGGYMISQSGAPTAPVNNLAIILPTPEGVHVRTWNTYGIGYNPFPRALDACS